MFSPRGSCSMFHHKPLFICPLVVEVVLQTKLNHSGCGERVVLRGGGGARKGQLTLFRKSAER